MHQGQGEEPEQSHHHHYLPNDNHDDNHHHGEYDPYPPFPPPTEGGGHHQPPPQATPQHVQPPLQPPKPSFSPRSRPPSSKKRATPPPPHQMMPLPPPHHQQPPLQPPNQPIFYPTSPPPKPRPQPYHRHGDNHNRYHDKNKRRQQLFTIITIILILLGLTALIIWLLYRPSKPQFTAISAAVYFLNATSPPPYVAASLQFTVLTRNPSKRTSLYYDNLAVVVHYRNHPITPPATLPPLHHLKRSTVMMSPEIGGGLAVAVPAEVVEELAMEEAHGVVELSWVLEGRLKYKAGWFSSGNNRVCVRCDVMVQIKSGGGNLNYGQVPLLGNPHCFVQTNK